MSRKTGIEKSESDKVQPYRVWYNGKIIWFAKSLDEAEMKLAEEKKGGKNLNDTA